MKIVPLFDVVYNGNIVSRQLTENLCMTLIDQSIRKGLSHGKSSYSFIPSRLPKAPLL